MSHDKRESETVMIDKKTPIKMTLGAVIALVVVVAGGVGMVKDFKSSVLTRLDLLETNSITRSENSHADCVIMFNKTWTIEDMAEWTHQSRGLTNNGMIPDISEVLRVTRATTHN